LQVRGDGSGDDRGEESDPFATQSSDSFGDAASQYNPHQLNDASQLRDVEMALSGIENIHGTSGSLVFSKDSVRRVSDQTVISDNSNVTVHRHPSRRSKSPIAILDSSSDDEVTNPFSDKNIIKDNPESSNASRAQGQLPYNSETGPINELEESAEYFSASASAPFRVHVPRMGTSPTPDDLCHRIFASTTPGWRERIRSKAARDFDTSAAIFGLETIERNMLTSGM
jgi:hypothetical protein